MKKLIYISLLLFSCLINSQTPFPSGIRLTGATKSDTLSGLTRLPIMQHNSGNLINKYVPIQDLGPYFNASDILAKLITVDGSGSGLDADLLDGIDNRYYLKSKNENYIGTPHLFLKSLTETINNPANMHGIFVFGDSMADAPSGYLLGQLDNAGLISGGMTGMPYYGNSTHGSGKGSNSRANNGATVTGVNDQVTTFGKVEWISNVYSLDAIGENVDFLWFGGYASNAITKIYILTEVGGGGYRIEKTINGGTDWTVELAAQSANAAEGMKVHTFDNLASSTATGYRVVWESGIVKIIEPLITQSATNFIHVKAGTGGADFRLQTDTPSSRVRFLIEDLNVSIFISNHRYEGTLTEVSEGFDKMDAWFINEPLDVILLQQWSNTNDIDADIIAENKIILDKCLEKGYLSIDQYNQLDGVYGVNLGGYNSTDPVHLNDNARDISGAALLDFLSIKNIRDLDLPESASEILTKIKTVDGSGSGLDADTVDSIHAASFLRSDTGTTKTAGNLNINDGLNLVFGNGTDWAIKHDGTSNRFDIYNGNFVIRDATTTRFTYVPTTGDLTLSGNATANSFVKPGGTSSQFLKADGSVDSSVYALDSEVVHLTGNESISGTKTFSDASSTSIIVNNSKTSGFGNVVTNSNTGTGSRINNTSSGIGLDIVNSGTGTAIGLRVSNPNTANQAMLVENTNIATTGTGITVNGGTNASFNYVGQLNGVNNYTVNRTGDVVANTLKTTGYTVATLPTGVTGMTAYVTDATAPTYLGTLTGGGSVVCPVFYNGTAWVSH